MQLLIPDAIHMRVGSELLRRCLRCHVRLDRLLPEAEAGEDMRGHVQRVRDGWSNPGITARRIECQLCKRRGIVGVNEVMGHSRMLWLIRKNFIENTRSLFFSRIGFVSWQRESRGDQRK